MSRIVRITGIAILVMALFAGFSYGHVFGSLVDMNDAKETTIHLMNARSLFLVSVLVWIGIFLLDLVAAYGMYQISKQFDVRLARIVGAARLVYSLILGVAVCFLGKLAMELIKMDMLAHSELVMQRIRSFEAVWSFALIIFGVHLLALGIVLGKSQSPKLINILLIVGGISYMVVHGMYTFLPFLDAVTGMVESYLVLPMALGELLLALWMSIRAEKLVSSRVEID